MVDRDIEIYFENNMTKYFIAKNDIPSVNIPKGSFVTLVMGSVSAISPDGTFAHSTVSPDFEVYDMAPRLVPARNVLWRKKDGTEEGVPFKMAKSFLQNYEPMV